MNTKKKERPITKAKSLLKVSSTITVLQDKSEIEAALNNQLEIQEKECSSARVGTRWLESPNMCTDLLPITTT
jgi:hypothetical protein